MQRLFAKEKSHLVEGRRLALEGEERRRGVFRAMNVCNRENPLIGGIGVQTFSIFINMSLPADIISKIVQCLMGLNVYKVILFGSYASGTATEDSDIDLVVILDTEEFAKTFDERMDRNRPISTALLEVNYLFPMDIIVYSKGEFEYLDKKESDFVREVKSTGKEIYGK